MAFELGGRADKFGNRYERRYFVSLMAKVLQGGLLSVQSEPTGDDESGTDIIVEYQGGRKDFHQCKARNGSNEHWTMSALARHKVFQHIKEHVKTEQNHFVFVTALTFVALNDLCLAARNSASRQCFVAHKNPQENTYNITSSNDPQNKSCQCLRDNVLNSIRGYAFRTIAETLWKHPEKVADWKTVLEHGLQDLHPSVRYAVIDALAAVSRVDKPFACEGYWEVLQQDPRCILHYTSGWFIMQLYPVHPEECRACLIWAFEQSETEQDLVRNAAHILAELCIKGDLDVHAYLFQRQYMPEQAYGILDQCFDDLNQEPKNTAAKRLLLYTLQNCQEIPQHIVWQHCREPGPHDPDVLRLFVERCANRAEYALIHFFLESRKENSPAWWENLYTFCARACADATKRYGLAVDDFCKLPFLLLETAATVQQREKALDVFDETFRSNVIQMENFLRETNR